MGKSTVSKWLREMNIPVDDADATVHRLYAPGGEAVKPIREAFGDGVLAEDGSIDRKSLSKLVVGEENKQKLQELEAIVHPLVEAARDAFIAEASRQSEPLCILDIPLLFEKHLEQHCDLVVVVSAPAEQQRARVLARKEMDPDKFTAILAKQVPDVEKRIRADRIVDTGLTLEETKAQVVAFIEDCRRQMTQERQRDRTLYWLLLGAALAMGVSAALALHRRKAGKGGSMWHGVRDCPALQFQGEDNACLDKHTEAAW
ncbi:coaE [Symbiodinium necroappetens]|uniref:CoaE protein n=1 Tax=Symbiodinium necroappetens TaxID=1628268 RepID=A0A812RP49_9DINO|nr:coaE [Symbiodinium necroappetens]